jgi:type I restriction enzyme, S subunit
VGPADSAIIPKKYDGAITGYDLVVRVRDAAPHYIAFGLLANYVLNNQLLPHTLRAAQPHLNREELGETLFILPSIEEQFKIVEHIEEVSLRIKKSIGMIKKEIHLMQEYRIALISEAVTGKIDVRDYQPELINSPAFELA